MAEGVSDNQQPQTPWQFSPGDAATPDAAPQPPMSPVPLEPQATAVPPQGAEGSISWVASEYIAHHKSPGWYLSVIGVAVVAAAIIWLLTGDPISTAVVVIGALVFAGYGARKPRQLEYRLDESGVTIGRHHVGYGELRSFSLLPEGAFQSIVLLPLKRFAPMTTIYFDPADQDKITALLSQSLPYEERQKDLIDRLMWRIKF